MGTGLGEAIMKRRRLLTMGIGSALLSVLFLWPRGTTHRISRENAMRVEVGMDEQEIENILGVPAGNYNPRGRVLALSRDLPVGPMKAWVGDELGLALWFDDRGRIRDKRIALVCQDRRSFFVVLRSWLRL